jgi:hypothetical protein
MAITLGTMAVIFGTAPLVDGKPHLGFPLLSHTLGLAYGFYALCAALSFLFVWQWVEETEGKSLEDMHGDAWLPRTSPTPRGGQTRVTAAGHA